MKKELTFKRILLAVALGFISVSCDTSGDAPKDDDGSLERTIIRMEIPSQVNLENYNWNNATLVWEEEFRDKSSFKDNWVFEKDANNLGNKDQLQLYKEENSVLRDGTLKIYARKIGEGQNQGDYTSSRISGRFAFQYGRLEVSVKFPVGEKNGIWSKLGLLGNNLNVVGYPDCGEIDLVEYFSSSPNAYYVVAHSAANTGNKVISQSNALEEVEEDFHAYGILWTKNYIKYYIDYPENIIFTLDRPSDATEFDWPYDQPFYFLIDMVVGGNYAGAHGVDDSMFPAVMEIDYVRVYHAL